MDTPYGSRFVPGDGPVPCDLCFVGEGPGVEENKWGRSWVGKAGRELWRYTWHALHRTRDSIYATNLVKYHVPKDGDPTDEDIKRDAPILDDEIRSCNPEIIVCLGRWSSRYFLGDVDMEVVHGVPHLIGCRCIHPIIHPAAGLHSTEFQGAIAWDFEQLGRLLRGEDVQRATVDEYPAPGYRIPVAGTSHIVCGAVDTEGSSDKPWCLSSTSIPGWAVVVRPGVARFSVAATFAQRLKLHNAPHDLGVLRAMGVTLEDGTYDDTMIKAYVLGVEPQGLKALAKRHCGMEMSDYSEIVAEANERHAFEWLQGATQWLSNRSTKESSASGTTTTLVKALISASAGKKLKKTYRNKRTS